MQTGTTSMAMGAIVAVLVGVSGLAVAQDAPKEKKQPGAPKAPATPATPVTPATPAEPEWVVLFDGTSADNFRGYRKGAMPESGWEVVDGTLHHKAGGGGGDIVTRGRYGDFELEFEWKVAEGANSGVMYRVSEEESAPYLTGSEYQILDNAKHADGKNPKTSAGAIYALYACEKDVTKPVGEWNQTKIVLKGKKVEHWLNGTKVVEAEIGSEDWKARVADSKFKDWPKFGTKDLGSIVFQDHGDDVWYRNIRIKAEPIQDAVKATEPVKEEVKTPKVGS